MRRRSWSRLLLPAAIAAFLQASPCLAFPPLPSSFYGKVKVNGANVPAGTVVRAVIAGHTYAEGYTQLYQGDSVFGLDVPGDDPGSPVVEGGQEGQPIAFEVGGLPASAAGLWHSGTNVSLDLAASGEVSLPTVTPSPVPTHTSSPTPKPSPSPRLVRPTPTRTPSPTLTSLPAGLTPVPATSPPAMAPKPAAQSQTVVPSAPASHSGAVVSPATAAATGAGSPPDTPASRNASEAQAQVVAPTATSVPDQPDLADPVRPEPTPLLAPAAPHVPVVPVQGQEFDWLATWRSRCEAGLAVVALAGCGLAGGLVWTLRRRK